MRIKYLAVAALLVVGCGGDDDTRPAAMVDSGPMGFDSGPTGFDSGPTGFDAGMDSGTTGFDAGTPGFDSGSGGFDAGLPGFDGSFPSFEGGLPFGDGGFGFGDGGLLPPSCMEDTDCDMSMGQTCCMSPLGNYCASPSGFPPCIML